MRNKKSGHIRCRRRIYLPVSRRLGITSGGLLNLKLPEPDATIGRTRGWLSSTIDEWNAKRPGRGVGGGRPRKNR